MLAVAGTRGEAISQVGEACAVTAIRIGVAARASEGKTRAAYAACRWQGRHTETRRPATIGEPVRAGDQRRARRLNTSRVGF
jgi:hypothetical protein